MRPPPCYLSLKEIKKKEKLDFGRDCAGHLFSILNDNIIRNIVIINLQKIVVPAVFFLQFFFFYFWILCDLILLDDVAGGFSCEIFCTNIGANFVPSLVG